MGCSVLILTKNEAGNIVDCIESCRLFGDEILVIDDFSSDDTVTLATQQGAKVLQSRMSSGWAAQRNYGISQAHEDWIFFIDADERCTPELAREIHDITRKNPEKAYQVQRLNHFGRQMMKYGALSPDWVLRLCPRTKSTYEGTVHESMKCDCPLAKLQFPMWHYTYQTWEQYQAKMARYSTMAAQKYFDEGKREYSALNILMRTFFSFVKMYILKRGFMDGRLGLFLACGYARYSFDKYIKLYFLSLDR